MTLHWWMHWFWITYQTCVCYSSMVTMPMHSVSVAVNETIGFPNTNVTAKDVAASNYIPPITTLFTSSLLNSTVIPIKLYKTSKKYDFQTNSTNRFTTVNPLIKITTVIDQNLTDVGVNLTSSSENTSFIDALNASFGNNYANRNIITNSELVEAKSFDTSKSSLTAAGITGITLGCVSIIGVICAASFIMYRNYGFNRLQVLNDRCSNPDSMGYIDDSTENSEEMYSLDNDSFLNSLEAMTIQNLWTDSVKHTKL
ncbi:uncharacterized protein LOC116165514 isoform X2 [Photinus pyralis]|uniref:uncharacterized protein LOC116165514 isoform X2 n=1 Tax=Photinus pyralis TaxID=7054 RepID=UPI001266EC10|nr:uncharacterized protein LOC116165514 isoform X2 [Photinus pyralis]